MTAVRPKLVVSLPARTVAEARDQIRLARDGGADLAELRVDRLPSTERAGLAGLFPSPLPLLATFRSREEGGEAPDDPSDRAPELLRLAGLPFRWIDVEFARDLPTVVRLPPMERLRRVVSSHLGARDAAGWEKRLGELTTADGVAKLVFPSSVPRALREVVPRIAARAGSSVVVHTTGASGPLLRALSGRIGAPLVFAALPRLSGAVPVEPSQIPVDELRTFLEGDATTPLFAVAGHPVLHSASPALHARWMRDDGRRGLYVPLDFPDDAEFLESLPMLAEQGFRGLNVTHPFKSAAFSAATDRRTGAIACRAANCLTFRGTAIEGENTDLAAILRRLEELRGAGRWDGRELAVLGAGGSARATLAAAKHLSTTATVYARRPEAARTLAEEFEGVAGARPPETPPSLVVHATSAGRGDAGPLALPLGPFLGPRTLILDWVYQPDDPAIRIAAEAANATYEDGWRLLVYQAAASYAIWWGADPSPASVDAALTGGGCAA